MNVVLYVNTLARCVPLLKARDESESVRHRALWCHVRYHSFGNVHTVYPLICDLLYYYPEYDASHDNLQHGIAVFVSHSHARMHARQSDCVDVRPPIRVPQEAATHTCFGNTACRVELLSCKVFIYYIF